LKECEPSRFLDEIDARFLKTEALKTAQVNTNSSFILQNRSSLKPMAKAKVTTTHTPSPDFAPSDTRNLQAGMRVEHPKFGFGTVKQVEAQGNDRKALIDFEQFGEKTILLSFAKLKIHE
jgi:DNA helicase-2/ATP-dependent DNA helicase PcrA